MNLVDYNYSLQNSDEDNKKYDKGLTSASQHIVVNWQFVAYQIFE